MGVKNRESQFYNLKLGVQYKWDIVLEGTNGIMQGRSEVLARRGPRFYKTIFEIEPLDSRRQ